MVVFLTFYAVKALRRTDHRIKEVAHERDTDIKFNLPEDLKKCIEFHGHLCPGLVRLSCCQRGHESS